MVKITQKSLKRLPIFALALSLVFVESGNKAWAIDAVAVVSDPGAATNAASIVSAQNSNSLAVIGSIATNVAKEIQSIVTFMNSMVDSLRLQTGQLTANTKRQIVAAGRIADAQDSRAVLREQQKAKLDAINTATSAASTCNVVTGNIGGQNIQNAVAIWREQVTEASINLAAGAADSPSRNGSEAGSEAVLGSHCKYNATDWDVQQGICSTATQPVTTFGSAAGLGAPLIGADLSASTILNPLNHVMSDSDTQSARNYIATAIVADPLGPLSKQDAQSVGGRTRIKARNTYIARSSAAAFPINDIFASEQPFATNVTNVGSTGKVNTDPNAAEGISLDGWANSTATQVLGYDRTAGAINFPQGVSKNAWLELRSRAWFMNPNWAIKVDGQRVDQTAKDLALMTSFMVFQNNEMYHKAEQTNFLLAHILAILNEGNRGKL